MTSFRLHVFLALMQVPGLKWLLSTPRTVRLMIAWDRCTGPARPNRRTLDRCSVAGTLRDGRTVYVVSPRDTEPRGHVLYLHGGAYVVDILAPHWALIARLVGDARVTATVPLYPLAPEADLGTALDYVLGVYLALIEHAPASEVTVIGDSAGGGLALALAQRLAELGRAQPARLILLSPWLDLSMSNPDIASVEPEDPYLSVAAALEAARLYAGPARLTHPVASPVYGAMKGLPPLAVFTGSCDILSPDARRLRDLVKAQGGMIDLFEHPGMIHAFMFFPLPEAEIVQDQIVALLRPESALQPVA
jgi:acetyl esterase/lipase